ncbi:MAG: alkane 1-monooxygenase [Pelagimonas sp.]|nr:alkane 1-monooxygenase [Pelagimonas sp.]
MGTPPTPTGLHRLIARSRFALVTGGLVALLSAALAWGGLWIGLALIYVTLFTWAMDRIAALQSSARPKTEFPAGDGLAVVLALVHFPLLYLGVFALTGETLSPIEKGLLFIALSLFFGQVSNSNAHELIHRAPRPLRRLGVAVYGCLLFGHHASAHMRVHHIHAATPRDPNSARLGEGFYRFAARAWRGALVEGYKAEKTLRKGTKPNPYAVYGGLALLSVALSIGIGGAAGALTLMALAAYAQLQLLLSDYVQHYGLRRREIAPGRYEPVGPQHSWNSPHGFSSALMLNAPRHSDHHSHPTRPYPGLALDRAAMPILPYSLPVMAVIALLPPLWRRVMDHRARAWAP